MAEQLHTTLTFVWDGDNGRVDQSSLQRLMAEDGIVIMDFLTDVLNETLRLQNEAIEAGGIWKRAS